MYGGGVNGGIATNSIYLFQLSHNTIVSYYVLSDSKYLSIKNFVNFVYSTF